MKFAKPVKKAEFLKSSVDLSGLPDDKFPEYAFTGRSNVGKSTLINMLCERKNLAKTSAKPGKTQTINHFFINDAWYLVDLPGYGYAKTGKKKRIEWQKFTHEYLLKRTNLLYVFVLIDASIPPKEVDLDFIRALGEEGIPVSIIFTKTDKPRQKDLSKNLKVFKEVLSQDWEEFPPMFTADHKGKGREEVLEFIEKWNKEFAAM